MVLVAVKYLYVAPPNDKDCGTIVEKGKWLISAFNDFETAPTPETRKTLSDEYVDWTRLCANTLRRTTEAETVIDAVRARIAQYDTDHQPQIEKMQELVARTEECFDSHRGESLTKEHQVEFNSKLKELLDLHLSLAMFGPHRELPCIGPFAIKFNSYLNVHAGEITAIENKIEYLLKWNRSKTFRMAHWESFRQGSTLLLPDHVWRRVLYLESVLDSSISEECKQWVIGFFVILFRQIRNKLKGLVAQEGQ